VATRSPRRFRFRRSVRTAEEGGTILEALARERLPAYARSVRYHRPRGPFCGVGSCTGCLVRANGQPGVRACRREVAEGDRIVPENSWPAPELDLLGAFDVLFPRGVDTLHGFRRPAFATPLYHRLVRRLAGFGKVPERPVPERPSSAARTLEARVAIVGAGSAGRAAAARAVALGVRPVVLERDREPSGIDGAELLTRTTCVVLSAPRPGTAEPFTLLAFAEGGGGVAVRASSVVVATGGYDSALLFEGCDRPGIVAADLVEALGRAGIPPPFRSAVVVGGGDRAREALDALGARAQAVVSFGEVAPELTRRASELSVPLYPRSLVVRARG
jgi:sarcosine oxidase subunit alpha